LTFPGPKNIVASNMDGHSEQTLRRTPLYNSHVKLGGKIVPFAGWELPVQYSGLVAEHNTVRSRAGLFDVSHMGEILVSGPEAEKALNYLTCNAVQTLCDGKGHYNAIINERGGVVDDIIIYRFGPQKFFICVNAANTTKDFAWFSSHNKFDAKFEDQSARFGQIALQGPRAPEILGKLLGQAVQELKSFHFMECRLASQPLIVARTGYTGEDGFELFIPWDGTEAIWETILETGNSQGLVPCGLGARDSLRLEACYPLHGHELSDDISAIESGLGWIVKFDKGDFMGRDILLQHKNTGAPRSITGLFIDDQGIARNGDKVFSNGALCEEIGGVTSGTKTPTVNRALALALIERKYAEIGTTLSVEVRGKRLLAHVVKRPFYKRS
jgi:aminomethyltransferase